MQNLSHLLTQPIFRKIGRIADSLGMETYAVGGYVRDLLIPRPSKDIDFVTIGSGIKLAKAVAAQAGPKTQVHTYANYGTAQIKTRDLELEFVGARRESYNRNSRNPIVEDGTLEEDINRRDFTINAMAICLNESRFGEFIDMHGGLKDLGDKIIRTPLDPDTTFSDDPLRMLRAIRFATQLDFDIAPETLESITRNAKRLEIITPERIKDEVMKIMKAPRPSIGWQLLRQTGLLEFVVPELIAMAGIQTVNGRGHKDNFQHTMQVLDTVAQRTPDPWVRWGALLHDIGKPASKRWDATLGWTFHNHDFIGGKMVPGIFKRLTLPMGSEMRKVQKLVQLHMRPIALVEDQVTDSAVRRLINYAEENLEDLMILARADITSKNQEKKQRYLENFDIVEQKFKAINALDEYRAFRPQLNGNEIMAMFNLPQGKTVGKIMSELTQASRDCAIGPTKQDAIEFVTALADKLGIIGTSEHK